MNDLTNQEKKERKLSEEIARKVHKANEEDLKKESEEKVKDLIADLSELKTKYQFRLEKNIKKYEYVVFLIDKIIYHINQ
jgi:uncharacterized FlaG/YvyC family protein